MKILVVDDDPKLRAFVERGLTESGMACTVAPDGETALERVRRDRPDLVLLDVMLPGLQGWDVLEAMRRESIDIPVIFVTARDGVDERVRGLRMGGDDYIVKPFAFSELVARIHVALRHARKRTSFRLADLEVDFLKGQVTRGGKRIRLTRTEYALLRCLADHVGEPVSRAALLESVWNIRFDPGTNVVEVHVRRLRSKVDEPFDRPLVHTERGSGYVLADRS